MLDCLIIGAGPAGLTAAIYLARYRRDICLVDAGSSRVKLISSTHNLSGFPDGIAGRELLQRLSDQAALYGVAAAQARIDSLALEDGNFIATSGTRQWKARTVILATGVKDLHPDIAGLEQATLAGLIRWCPICDGFEAMDQSIGIISPPGPGAGHALFLRTYSDRITLLASADEAGMSSADRSKLEAAGVEIVTEAIVSMRPRLDEKCVLVELRDGSSRRFDVVYPMYGTNVQSQLATTLGASRNEDGDLVVDEGQRTSLPGLYAVGDVVCALNQISVGIGHAAVAATRIHNELPSNPRAQVD